MRKRQHAEDGEKAAGRGWRKVNRQRMRRRQQAKDSSQRMRRRQQTKDAEKTAGHKDVEEEEMIQRWQDGGLGRRRDGSTRRF